MAWLVFCKKKYLTEYRSVLSKMRVHVEAISRGPIQHYFETLFQQDKTLYESIDGHCSKCGNCCLNRSCVFLESIGDDQFSCGIYHSRLRRFSNCGSFPINGHDIGRYQCPTYKVIRLESTSKFTVESSSSSKSFFQAQGKRDSMGSLYQFKKNIGIVKHASEIPCPKS